MANPNDSAYPETNGAELMWAENSEHAHPEIFPRQKGGFTKREIVLKDFMCAIIKGAISNPNIQEINHDGIALNADNFVTAYFNQLNKTTNE